MEIDSAATTSSLTASGRRAELARLARFGLVGASGFVVNFVVFWLLTRGGVSYPLAAVASFAVAVANNYAWNRLWTFREQAAEVLPQGARFAAVAVLSLGANLIVLHACVAAGLRPLAGQVIAIALVTPVNYLGNRLWSFNADVSLRAMVGAERLRAYRRILGWGLLSRAVVFGTALVLPETGWLQKTLWLKQPVDKPLSILGAWDGRWYRILASRGYIDIPKHQSDTAFFPLYPALMHALNALGLSLHTAGLVLANAGFVLGLLALYELARAWLPPSGAERAAIYAALFPLGFVFSMSYPEGLVLAAMAGASVCAYRRRWTSAALLAAAATLARPEGLFLALPIGALVLSRRRELRPGERGAALAAVVAAPAALAAVAAYQQLTVGSAFAFSQAQQAWGRHFSPIGIAHAVHELLHATGQNQWLWRDVAFCAVYLVLLGVALRAGVPKAWIAAGALIVLLPLESGSFTSDGRFGLLALPVYAGLARVGHRRFLDLALRASMLGLLAVGTATLLLRWP